MVKFLRYSMVARNNILVVEDHPLYRDALILVLQNVIKHAEILSALSAKKGLHLASGFTKLHLILFIDSCTNQEIAAQVGLAEITVKQNITVIFHALGVENRAQALLAIRRFGLIVENRF